ncbi:hypothetical protein OFN42_07095, partial [Escherichia coli]|nr:hypothetical protein [Escherichia coli]MCV5740152.1 hypothetical protein [Escherichia coli]
MCITFKSHYLAKGLVMNTLRYFDFGAARPVLLLIARIAGNDSNLLIVFYVQIMPDDFVMQLHR